jgi:hypothetical protein
MFKGLIRASAVLTLALAAPLAAQPAAPAISEADLLRHIRVLASDDFQGRKPGTEGEQRTTAYLIEQFRARGLEPAGDNGGWLQTFGLVTRRPEQATLGWTGPQPGQLAASEIVATGRAAREALSNLPIVFAAHGARMPDRGIDQLAGADLRGAAVLILADGPAVEGFPTVSDRVRAVTAAGAAAIIVILSDDTSLAEIRTGLMRSRPRADEPPRLLGFIRMSAAQRLVAGAGGDMNRLLNEQPGSSFRPVALPGRLSGTATTAVSRIETSNVIGRLRGSGPAREAVMLLAHWDHLGLCAPEGAPDRICNGAVDNASGIAALIEIAGQLSRGDRPVRDVLFLATSAEEVGLVGAGWFADHPTVPLDSILAAINMDTIAIAPAGTPVAIMRSGVPGLDALVAATVTEAGRRLDPDDEAAMLVQRQDGWALARRGVPALMLGGSFSDMAMLGRFLQGGRYHRFDDHADGEMVLAGAVEDTNLTVALVRRLADPAQYQRPQQGPAR